MGEPGRLCVGDLAGSARFVLFSSETHLLYRRGRGRDRVDISVQLLVSLIIVLH